MRDVAIVSFAEMPAVRREWERDEVEMLVPVIREARERAGIDKKDIGFTVSGSTDFLTGRPFSFVIALDAVGAWPPIEESHVEMDGAFALYEAWVRLQHGDVDTALVYAFGRSSLGEVRDVLTMQLDPYYVGPLWPDAVSLAALQARALLDGGRATERAMAEIAARSRRSARDNPTAQLTGDSVTMGETPNPPLQALVDALLAEPYLVAPLRKHDCPPISDGACAVVLAAGDRARSACARPAWIRGIDHRIEPHALGARDLTRSPSTMLAAEKAGVKRGPVDVAEIHAPFTHQEIILRDALGLGPGVNINPSGGALAANPVMVAGLTRIGAAAQRILDGRARRAVAHATSGPCLQQNLVAVLEADA
jgi:acetyl-CoA acetyltransferase